MMFQEVVTMKTALDRAAAYAEKINELSAMDCGLDAWIFDATMQKRGKCHVSLPPSGTLTSQIRHVRAGVSINRQSI
jgi:hypothetical protein